MAGDTLLENGFLFSDVTLVVHNEKIEAHKIILATRSPVFEKMFTSEFKEKDSKEVELNVRLKEFKLLLKYMYTSNLEEKVTIELILLAEMYMVQSFFEWYFFLTYKKLNCETAMKCLLAAVLTRQTTFIQYVVNYIVTSTDVKYSNSYKILSNREDVMYALFVYGPKSGIAMNKIWEPIVDIDAENYFNSEQFSDITIIIGNHEIKAHKAFLAVKSEIFKQMFEKEYLNAESNVLVIDDFDETNFELFLKYLYSNKLHRDQINSTLFYIAFAYKVISLAQICQFKLISELSSKNVLEYYYMSIALNCIALRDHAKNLLEKEKIDMFENDLSFSKDIDTLKTAFNYLLDGRLCDYNEFPLSSMGIILTFKLYNLQRQKMLDSSTPPYNWFSSRYHTFLDYDSSQIQLFIYYKQKWIFVNNVRVNEPKEVINHPLALEIGDSDFVIALISGTRKS